MLSLIDVDFKMVFSIAMACDALIILVFISFKLSASVVILLPR